MDWVDPIKPAVLLPVALAALVWWHVRSQHPMSQGRRRALTVVRCLLVALILLCLAGPALQRPVRRQAVIFVMDHSRSQGERGMLAAYERAARLSEALSADSYVGYVSAGASTVVRRRPTVKGDPLGADLSLIRTDGAQTDLAAAVALASGMFPPGTQRRLVLIGDGVQTRGDLEAAARDAAAAGIVIDAAPVAGEMRKDVRVVRLGTSRSRLHEGAALDISADVESTVDGEGRIRLFQNGIEVETRPLKLLAGQTQTVTFHRTPRQRNLYTYRVRVEGFAEDAIPENNEAMAIVDVRGRPVLLYVEGQEGEAHYLAEAMAREGLRLDVRPADAVPQNVQDLLGYDAIVLSDVPAYKLAAESMSAIRDYVEKLGGGFVMIGGVNSFGVGGYYRTPIEEILPVKMTPPDMEEHQSVALALVLDRSGSMSGIKIEMCKSAAIATVELLGRNDFVGVVAFDSSATWIVPMTSAARRSAIAGRISSINSGGGTNIFPAMSEAHQALVGTRAKIKHMIVLSDGHTQGGDYSTLAMRIKADGCTVSTIAIGPDADLVLLGAIAAAGGGQFYHTFDPGSLPRVFTQDTMAYAGRLIREEAFQPQQVERHPMLKGWEAQQAPQLLGYVSTDPRATAQVPLVTDLGQPLLAHWRFGLGKVTAFTSDCKSRWASLWLTNWSEGYSQMWAQILRETAREPQGRLMDVRIEERGEKARIIVDLLEDPAHYNNEATVQADVYFAPAQALDPGMKLIEQVELQQEGPGRYVAQFTPDEPGLYLVRARAGGNMVSAALVHEVSWETATGAMDKELLEKVCAATGGKLLQSPDAPLPPLASEATRLVELSPILLKLLLLLFLADVVLRRWEHVRGAAAWTRQTGAALGGRLSRRIRPRRARTH